MADYRGLAQVTVPLVQRQPYVPQAEPEPYEFGPQTVGLGQSQIARGIQSAYNTGMSDIQGYGASIADALGADQLAKEWYANALARQQQAEETAPRVRTLGEAVESPGNFVDYAAGQVGGFLPYMALGGVGGMVGRGVGALRGLRGAELAQAAHLGGAASFQPFMAGGTANQLHNDPAARGMSPQEVLARSQGVGAAEAYAGAAVPAMMTNRLFNRAAIPAGESLAPRAATGRALTEAAGNAVGGGAGMAAMDVIGQGHRGTYDQNYTFNPGQTGEAFAGGVTGMAPFSLAHAGVAQGLDVANTGARRGVNEAKTQAERAYEFTKAKAEEVFNALPDGYKNTLKGMAEKAQDFDQFLAESYDILAPHAKMARFGVEAVAEATWDRLKGLAQDYKAQHEAGVTPDLTDVELDLTKLAVNAGTDVRRATIDTFDEIKKNAQGTALGTMFDKAKSLVDIAKTWETAADPSKSLVWLKDGEDKMDIDRLRKIKAAMGNASTQAKYADTMLEILEKAGEDNASVRELREFATRLRDEAVNNRAPNDKRTSPLTDDETMRMFTAVRVAAETAEVSERLKRVLNIDTRLKGKIDAKNPIPEKFSKQQGEDVAIRSVKEALTENGIDPSAHHAFLKSVQEGELLANGATQLARKVVTRALGFNTDKVGEKAARKHPLYKSYEGVVLPALEKAFAEIKAEEQPAHAPETSNVSPAFKEKVGYHIRKLFDSNDVGRNFLSEEDGGQSKIDALTEYIANLAEQHEGYDKQAGMRLMTLLKGAFGEKAEPFIEGVLRESDIEFGGLGKSAKQSAGLASMLEAHNDSRDLAREIVGLLENTSEGMRSAGGRRKMAPVSAAKMEVEGRKVPAEQVVGGERFADYPIVERLLEGFREARQLDGQARALQKRINELALEAQQRAPGTVERNAAREQMYRYMDMLRDGDPDRPGTSQLEKRWVSEGIVTSANFEPLMDLLSQYQREGRLTKAEGGKARDKGSTSNRIGEVDLEDYEHQQDQANAAEPDDLFDKRLAESGQQGEVQEPPRFYGTEGFKGGKYDPTNIGAPVSRYPSGDYKRDSHPDYTQSIALGQKLDAVVSGHRVGRREEVRMHDWADEMANIHGGTPEEHLNRALEALLKHDQERLQHPELDQDSKDVALARARMADTLRDRHGELTHRAGDLFFSDRMNSPYRYHRVEPHDASNLAYSIGSLENRYALKGVDPETWAEKRAALSGFDKSVFLNSLLPVRKPDGTVIHLDLARMVTFELAHHQDADISGLGDKRIDQTKAEEILTAADNVVAAILTAKGMEGAKNALLFKGGRAFESEDASLLRSKNPEAYYLHTKGDHRVIDKKPSLAGYETSKPVTATSWVDAKKQFGFKLEPLQDMMLHDELGLTNVHLNKDIVVYREQTPLNVQTPGVAPISVQPATPRFYTLGQLGRIAERDSQGRTTSATVYRDEAGKRQVRSPGEITPEVLKTVLSKGSQVEGANEVKVRDADNRRGVARNGVMSEGKPYHVKLHELLVNMLERNGIDPQEMSEKHLPDTLAGMLLREAIAEMKTKGYDGDLFDLAKNKYDNLTVYTKQYGDTSVPVTFGTLKRIIANPDIKPPRNLEDAMAYDTLKKMQAADKIQRELDERNRWNKEHAAEIEAGTVKPRYRDSDTSPLATVKRAKGQEDAYQDFDRGSYAPWRDDETAVPSVFAESRATAALAQARNELETLGRQSTEAQEAQGVVDRLSAKHELNDAQRKALEVAEQKVEAFGKGKAEFDKRYAAKAAEVADLMEKQRVGSKKHPGPALDDDFVEHVNPGMHESEEKYDLALDKVGMLEDYLGNKDKKNIPLADKNEVVTGDKTMALTSRDEPVELTPEQIAARKAATDYDYVKSLFDRMIRATKGDPDARKFVKETFFKPLLDPSGTKLSKEFQAWMDARELAPSEINGWDAPKGEGAKLIPGEKAARGNTRTYAVEGDHPKHQTVLNLPAEEKGGRTANDRLGPLPEEKGKAPTPVVSKKNFNAEKMADTLANQAPMGDATSKLVASLDDAQLREVLLALGSRSDIKGSSAEQVSRVMASPKNEAKLEKLGLEYNTATEKFEPTISKGAFGEGTPFSKQQKGSNRYLSQRDADEITKKMLNGIVGTEIVRSLGRDTDKLKIAAKITKDMISIAQDGPDPLGSLHHEIWHKVEDILKELGPHGERVLESVYAHMKTPLMEKWIRDNYARYGEEDPGVASQMDSMSERAAFAFQKFAEGADMPVAAPTKGIFEHLKNAIKWIADKLGFKTTVAGERTENFFKYVQSGEFARDMDNAASVRKGLGEKNGDNVMHEAAVLLKPGLEALKTVFEHTSTRVRDLNIPEYNTIMTLLAGEDGKGGYMNDKRRMEFTFDNDIGEQVKHLSEKQIEAFQHSDEMTAFRGRVEEYMKKAGVTDSQALKLYDRLWSANASKIGENIEEFITDLVQHGGFKGRAGDARTLAGQIADRGFFYDKDRELFPNRPDLKDKWSERDFGTSMARYIMQSVDLAEKTRERTGDDGKKYRMNDLKSLLEAGNAKADSTGQQLMQDTIDAYEGTLAANKLSPGLKKFMGTLLFINNVRLLPKAVFSQMLEPMQLALRRGTMSGSLSTLWRGIREMPRSFDKLDKAYTPDYWEKLANQIGTAPSRIIANVMAQMQNGMTLPGKIGHWNDQFFKLNFMDQWNRSMHIEATKHAVEFLKEHAAIIKAGKDFKEKNGDFRSQRFLRELGLTEKDIKLNADGELIIDKSDLGNDKVARALSQYVNEAMAHPDAGSNPLWMNDPRFALLAQMKRFTFAHSRYVLDHGIKEYKLGNAFPLVPAIIAMPWMMAADGLRDTLTMTDTSYKNNWGFMDYAEHAYSRAGHGGRGQFLGDVEQSVRHGGNGLEGAAGPTAELFGRFARGMHTGQWFDAMVNQVPGAPMLMPD